MQISNIRYGHAYQIKLLLLWPEKGSRRECAQILSFTICHTQAITLGRHGEQDDRWFTTYNLGRISVLLFFYLFVFFQEALLHLARIGKVKAELCTHYLSVRNKGYVVYQMENNGRKKIA